MSPMQFLVTNDDGIDVPGLAALVSAASSLGEPVVVAPAAPQSGVSHAVTWHEGVRIEPRGEKQFAIHGTPADCTRLGLLHLARPLVAVSVKVSYRSPRRGAWWTKGGTTRRI